MKLLSRLLVLIALTLLPIIGIEVFDEIEARAQRAAEGKDQALRLVRLVAEEQSKVMEGARQLLTALGRTPSVRGGAEAPCSTYLDELAAVYPQYLGFVSVDPSGHPICAGGRIQPHETLAEAPWFKLAVETGGFVPGQYEADAVLHTRAFYLAQPYYDVAGNLAGVVAAAVSLDWLNDELAKAPLPEKSTVSVIDRQGTILARNPGREKFVGTQIAGGSHAYLLGGGEGVQEALGFDQILRIYSYAPVPGYPSGLTVSVGLDKGVLMQAAEAADRRDIAVIAGSSVLAMVLALLGARLFISRPIGVLLGAAEDWKKGDLERRVLLPEARSEFGRLGDAFNAMAAAIGAREQVLEARVRERTSALQDAMQAQQAAEAALHEAHRLEAIGRLTGGVAHDFNNLLAAIVGNLELARARLGPDHPERRRLDAAMQSANRGAVLVQQLLAFARRQNLHPEVVDLNGQISGSSEVLQRLLRSDVTVETVLSPATWLVRVDPNQLEAAILNLAINARDAMPGGGTLRIETRNARLTNQPGQPALEGDFVALTVSDTGMGIPAEILDKVFDPFFTTKDIGAGSGLGLSMVQGFARQSSGSVHIDSTLGVGTSVTLYLPRSLDALVVAAEEGDEPEAGEGTILLVDDDETVRSVTAELLEMSGYTVFAMRNASEALRFIEREGDAIDLLVTDLVLARSISGLELAEIVRRDRPGLPVVLITGYSDALLDKGVLNDVRVLGKPFEFAVLASTVAQAMRIRQEAVPV